ncbi:related to uracil permease [Rhynchosporium secalis]|uniref:Related to uracil permease n=1 Tax=Rhynchosporium secalis TaxID=38038 RepID=A0A1E1M7Q9_RHYSE|nr:related to uracil permease [Rhynchosporium secalis]
MSLRKRAVEFVTLSTNSGDEVSVWINDDIRPLPPHRRTWNTMAFISFWAINQIALGNWQLGSSLVAVGLSVWQTMIAVILGKFIVAAVALCNGAIGAKWHIGFPVMSRGIWGIYGAYLIIIQRIILSLTWFAVQSWTGGLCVSAVLSAMFPSFMHLKNTLPESANTTTSRFLGWVVYNMITVPILYVKPEKTAKLLFVMNGISLTTLVSMMIYLLAAARGGGPLLSAPATAQSSSALGWAITQGVTTVIGGIAVGLTNQSDYSRFARKPGDQVFGQWFSIITLGTILPLFGCLSSSASLKLYGEAYWNPPDVLLRWLDDSYSSGTRAAVFFAGVGLVICQLAINTIDNSFSAGMDLAGLLPKYLNIRRGAYIALVLSIVMCPWQLLASAGTFISVMGAYSVFLGPMCGIQITDYFLIRQRKVKLSDMYSPSPSGIYYFWKGVNPRAFVAWCVGWAPQLPGFIANVNPDVDVPDVCMKMFYLAFPLGLVISATVYYLLCRFALPRGIGEIDNVDYFGTFNAEEAARLGISPISQLEGIDDRGEKDDVRLDNEEKFYRA